MKFDPSAPTQGSAAIILWFISPKKRPLKRIFLFIVTNLAVLALLSTVIFVVEQVFGLRLPQGGLGGLLVFAAVCGFGGALEVLKSSHGEPMPPQMRAFGINGGRPNGGAGKRF